MGRHADNDRDFGAILAEFERESSSPGVEEDPPPGSKVSGEVLSIGREAVFVDVGARSDAVVDRGELTGEDGELTVALGDTVEGLITGRDPESGCLLLRVRPGRGTGLGAAGSAAAVAELAQAHAHGMAVEGSITGTVKGGVEVTVSGIRAFCPVSQLDLAFVEDPSEWVGRRLEFRIRRFEASGRGGRPDVVLSRRDLLEEERRRRRREALEKLAPGAVVRGTVTSVTSYGAFVDLGGVEGLLHVSEMSHQRIEDPADFVSPQETIEVQVLSVEEREEGEVRISLSHRALQRDPWQDAGDRFPIGTTVGGRVVRLERYGAFVRIAPGLDGLLHVSELAADRRVDHPRDVLELGQEVQVRILRIDPEKRRISLTLVYTAPDVTSRAVEEYADRQRSSQGFGSMADFFRKASDDD